MPDLFGVAVSPFELDEWQAATGITVDLCMIFEAWSRQRNLADTFAKAKAFGHQSIMVTWEPWEPTPVGTPPDQQGQVQPKWSNAAILRGDHDAYIDAMARSMRDSGLTVYLRYGHEMNGGWYPWSTTPQSYVDAWRYIRNRMRSQRNAWNVKFVWAPNPDLWRATPADWLNKLLPYWPGPASVEYIGFTVIEFGGDKDYPVSRFAERFDLTRKVFNKPVLACETNVAKEMAVPWLDDLSAYVANGTRPLPIVTLSQGPSRAEAGGGTGDLSWNAMTYPEGCEATERLVAALHQP